MKKCSEYRVPSGKLPELWKITMFNWKTRYFNGHILRSYFDITRGCSLIHEHLMRLMLQWSANLWECFQLPCDARGSLAGKNPARDKPSSECRRRVKLEWQSSWLKKKADIAFRGCRDYIGGYQLADIIGDIGGLPQIAPKIIISDE